jgi:hypothetical protein
VNDEARDGAFDDGFRMIAHALSGRVFEGAPVEIWLLDDELEVRRRVEWVAP